MNKKDVALLALDLFKIRISSSNEGLSEDDGVHKMKIKGIGSYNPTVIKKWYIEALKTAEIILSLEEEYINS